MINVTCYLIVTRSAILSYDVRRHGTERVSHEHALMSVLEVLETRLVSLYDNL